MQRVGRSTVEINFHSDSSIDGSKANVEKAKHRSKAELRKIQTSTQHVRFEVKQVFSLRSYSSCEVEPNPYLLSAIDKTAH
jgi:hypothetical protein